MKSKFEDGFILSESKSKYLRQLIIDKLQPIIKGRDVIHIDIPYYLNIGDLLIDEGTTKAIIDCGANLERRYSVYEKHTLVSKKIKRDVIILLQGGGNFGDLYPIHQQFRNEVIRKFQENQIIVMPQSIHYDDLSHFDSDIMIYNKHDNITIFARDNISFELLKERMKPSNIGIMPDMAMALINRFDMGHKGSGTLYFRRKDKERIVFKEKVNNDFDWEDIVGEKDRIILKKCRKNAKKERLIWFNRRRSHYLFEKLKKRLIMDAIMTFRSYDVIDTDRLHGMILANLLGKKVVPRDNSYRKIARYIDTWY